MSSVVLDASALLAVLRREPGREVVEPVLAGAMVSAVNYSEVIKKAVEVGGDASDARTLLQRMNLAIVPFDEPHAVEAGALYARTAKQGFSFADRACLSLGMIRRLPIVTAERRFAKLDLPVDVRLIRHAN